MTLTSLGKIAAASLLVLGLLPLQAQAHRLWIKPSATQVDSSEPWITVDAAVSENLFDFDTNAVKLDGLSITGPDGAPVAAENQATGKLRSSFDLKLAKPGTYKIALVAESMMATYKQDGETRRWRGTPETYAKEVPANADDLHTSRMQTRLETFVTADKPSTVAAFKPSGAGLELMPLTHPNDMQVGKPAAFRFLLDGKPASNLVLSIVPGGVRYRGVLKEIRATTDAKGEFSVAWPEAGMYWIGTNWPARGATPEGQMPPLRLSYSATLEVLPE